MSRLDPLSVRHHRSCGEVSLWGVDRRIIYDATVLLPRVGLSLHFDVVIFGLLEIVRREERVTVSGHVCRLTCLTVQMGRGKLWLY